MSIRTKILSGRNVVEDTDFSKFIETITEPGVIEGFSVSNNSVAVGKAWLLYERENGDTVYGLVENFSTETIDTSGTGYVIIYIDKDSTQDGTIISEDGTGIATIEVVEELPTKNYLLLAQLDSGVIIDNRNMIKKIGELDTDIEGLWEKRNNLTNRIVALEESQSKLALEESGLVGELYNSSNTMLRQITPKASNSTIENCKVGDTAANTEIHIQRIASGVESNKLKLYVKKVGNPTNAIYVEVRKGIQVNVNSTEAYWYGDGNNILATGNLASSNITTSFAEKEFTLNNNISVDRGTLLDIVVYQNGKTVDSSNYYIVGCDSTQWSEAFSYVSVNGNTRSRSKLCPYCISNSFETQLIVKYSSSTVNGGLSVYHYKAMNDWNGSSGVNANTPGRGYVYSNNNPQTPYNYTETGILIDIRFRLANASMTAKVNGNTIRYTSSGSIRDTGYVNQGYISNATILQQASDTSYGGSYFLARIDYHTLDTIAIHKSGQKMKPIEVKGLGVLAKMNSFGRIGMNWFTGK